MSNNLRPMLACQTPKDLQQIRMPVYASFKVDGIRALIVNGQALSRTLKPIRNRFVRQILNNQNLNGLDGELIVGDPTAKDCFRASTSGVMSEDGEPSFKFYSFDHWYFPGPFESRLKQAQGLINQHANPEYVQLHSHCFIQSLEQLLEMEEEALSLGYEGLITRDPYGEYKYGRSTIRDQGMTKLKRFTDSEAEVVGVQELQHNANEAKISALGYTERSAHQGNKIGLGMLGALVCRGIPDQGFEFAVGTGFTASERQSLWDDRSSLIGRIVKIKSFPVGIKDKPRHPVFLGFRDPDDL